MSYDNAYADTPGWIRVTPEMMREQNYQDIYTPSVEANGGLKLNTNGKIFCMQPMGVNDAISADGFYYVEDNLNKSGPFMSSQLSPQQQAEYNELEAEYNKLQNSESGPIAPLPSTTSRRFNPKLVKTLKKYSSVPLKVASQFTSKLKSPLFGTGSPVNVVPKQSPPLGTGSAYGNIAPGQSPFFVTGSAGNVVPEKTPLFGTGSAYGNIVTDQSPLFDTGSAGNVAPVLQRPPTTVPGDPNPVWAKDEITPQIIPDSLASNVNQPEWVSDGITASNPVPNPVPNPLDWWSTGDEQSSIVTPTVQDPVDCDVNNQKVVRYINLSNNSFNSFIAVKRDTDKYEIIEGDPYDSIEIKSGWGFSGNMNPTVVIGKYIELYSNLGNHVRYCNKILESLNGNSIGCNNLIANRQGVSSSVLFPLPILQKYINYVMPPPKSNTGFSMFTGNKSFPQGSLFKWDSNGIYYHLDSLILDYRDIVRYGFVGGDRASLHSLPSFKGLNNNHNPEQRDIKFIALSNINSNYRGRGENTLVNQFVTSLTCSINAFNDFFTFVALLDNPTTTLTDKIYEYKTIIDELRIPNQNCPPVTAGGKKMHRTTRKKMHRMQFNKRKTMHKQTHKKIYRKRLNKRTSKK